jgi:hypothetical protein
LDKSGSLPRRVMAMTFLAGGLFVGGTVGVEMVSAVWAEAHGSRNLTYKAITVVEEFLELAGLILWNYALLTYLEIRGVRIEFAAAEVRLSQQNTVRSIRHEPEQPDVFPADHALPAYAIQKARVGRPLEARGALATPVLHMAVTSCWTDETKRRFR